MDKKETRKKSGEIYQSICVIRENVIGLLQSGCCVGNWGVMEALSIIHSNLESIERVTTSLTADLIRAIGPDEKEE